MTQTTMLPEVLKQRGKVEVFAKLEKTPYEFLKDPSQVEKIVPYLMGQKVTAYDTETTGRNCRKDKVILASIATHKKTFVIDTRNPNCLAPLKPYFESRDVAKIMHYGQFDYNMTRGTCGIEIENIYCTYLGELVLTAGLQYDGYGLGDVTKKYLGIEMDKALQKSFINHTGEFTTQQIQYSADDTPILLPLAKKMKEEMAKLGVVGTWKTECGAIQAFSDIEYYGQKISVPGWQKIMQGNLEAANKAKLKLDEFFEHVCNKAWSLEPGHESELVLDMNYDSPSQLLYGFQMLGMKVEGETIKSTDKKTLQKLIDQFRGKPGEEVVRALSAYRSAQVRRNTFGQTYIDAIDPITGRIHFGVNQHGTGSGRPACYGGLNCLNIPREKIFRNAFITDPDRLISTVDYSGAELMIMADLSNDELMVKGFNSGIDFHCFVATLLFAREVTKSNENKHLRTPTKSINFGLAYGSGASTLMEQLHAQDYPITLEECISLMKLYKQKFSTCVGWLREQQNQAKTQFRMSNINGRTRRWREPNRFKVVETIKHELLKKNKNRWDNTLERALNDLVDEKLKGSLAAIAREGANHQIQSVNADMSKDAMHVMRLKFKDREYDVRFYNQVYDEIVLDIHQSCAQEVHEIQKQVMIDEANKMLKHVKMKVEGFLGPCWTK